MTYHTTGASVFVDENIQEGRGDNVALLYGDETLRVMLLLLDSPEFVASFFGAIKIGAVPIPANTMLKANDFLYFLNDS
jgi:benzoate-CoA ligase